MGPVMKRNEVMKLYMTITRHEHNDTACNIFFFFFFSSLLFLSFWALYSRLNVPCKKLVGHGDILRYLLEAFPCYHDRKCYLYLVDEPSFAGSHFNSVSY